MNKNPRTQSQKNPEFYLKLLFGSGGIACNSPLLLQPRGKSEWPVRTMWIEGKILSKRNRVKLELRTARDIAGSHWWVQDSSLATDPNDQNWEIEEFRARLRRSWSLRMMGRVFFMEFWRVTYIYIAEFRVFLWHPSQFPSMKAWNLVRLILIQRLHISIWKVNFLTNSPKLFIEQ